MLERLLLSGGFETSRDLCANFLVRKSCSWDDTPLHLSNGCFPCPLGGCDAGDSPERGGHGERGRKCEPSRHQSEHLWTRVCYYTGSRYDEFHNESQRGKRDQHL